MDSASVELGLETPKTLLDRRSEISENSVAAPIRRQLDMHPHLHTLTRRPETRRHRLPNRDVTPHR